MINATEARKMVIEAKAKRAKELEEKAQEFLNHFEPNIIEHAKVGHSSYDYSFGAYNPELIEKVSSMLKENGYTVKTYNKTIAIHW